MHLLGVVAHQIGRHEQAVDLTGKAIALNNQVPAFHNNIAVALYQSLHRCRVVSDRTRGQSRAADRSGFQNPWDGMRNARLKREDAFSQAMIIVSSAMVSSS